MRYPMLTTMFCRFLAPEAENLTWVENCIESMVLFLSHTSKLNQQKQ